MMEEVIEVRKVKSEPKIRFLEFNKAWSLTKLGSRVEKVGSGVTPKGGAKVYTNTGIIFIRSQNINHNRLILDDVTFIPAEIHLKMSGSEVHPNDILLNITGASIGRSCVVPKSICLANVNQHVCIIRLKKGENPYFYQSFLSSYDGQKLIYQNQAGGGREGLNFQSIKSFKIFTPSLPEQQKIASFLSSVDKKIQQLTRKKERLEKYKKGVMQKLFPPAGGQVPEIRFKNDDGGEFPEWEEKRLGEILNFISTNSFSRNDLTYKNGLVMNIHYGDIHTKFNSRFDIKKEDVPFLNSNIDVDKIPDEQYCKAGDIIIADASEDYNDIGKAIEIVNFDSKKIVAGLHTFLARDKNSNTVVGFKGYLFQSWKLRKEIMRIAQGISVLGISKKNLSELKVGIPTKEEQEKIVSFLSNIDIKIDSVEIQLKKMQQFKKGLLQQMFV